MSFVSETHKKTKYRTKSLNQSAITLKRHYPNSNKHWFVTTPTFPICELLIKMIYIRSLLIYNDTVTVEIKTHSSLTNL